ncbi:hypothetical protein [Sandarakinorhabdus sp.]|uniref:hypothetical protein n=1 Tax=Sandarakinorhabdus sp. TaxID=1916663 RepID=UPI0033416F8D
MGYTESMSSNTPPAPKTFLRPQHNGWSPERQQRFLDHLALHGNVSAAARAAEMTKQSAYWLRAQAHSQDFAQRWDAALADTGRWIEDMALDRLRDGEEEVFEREGVVVAVRRRPADVRLLLFHLKRLEREKQKAQPNQRPTPPDSESVANLRAELRALAAMPHDPEDDIVAPDWPLAPFAALGG